MGWTNLWWDVVKYVRDTILVHSDTKGMSMFIKMTAVKMNYYF